MSTDRSATTVPNISSRTLAEVSGVGERKLDAYGEAFLQLLQTFPEKGGKEDALTQIS